MSISREDKYQKIIDAAIEAFAESGYHQCQVSKIARLAGVADGTIYLYFKNKEEILIQLFEERMGDFIHLMRRELEACQNTRRRLEALIKTHFSYMENNRSLAIVTQVELRQPNAHLRSAISGPLKAYFQLIEEVIQKGIECQEIRPVNVRIARQMIFGAIDETTTGWVLARSKRTLSQDAESLLDLFVGALRSPEEKM